MKSSILPITILIQLSINFIEATLPNHGDNSFDLLIFAQSWPMTNCIEWKERSKGNTCQIPKNIWTVHGIWPTRYNVIGPNYCEPAKPFDPEALDPILEKLEAHWTNIHANAEEDSFWAHEWKKHGSCAANLTQLDSELKYFTQGVEWNIKYPLYDILSAASIVPGSSYSFNQIFTAVQSQIGGHRPAVICEYDEKLHNKILAQINICFDKDLELTDCDRIKGGINQFCPKGDDAHIYYPERVDYSPNQTRIIISLTLVSLFIAVPVAFHVAKKLYLRRLYSGYEAV